VSAYRVAAVVVSEPEVAWAERPKLAFARGEKRYTRKMLGPLVAAGTAFAAAGVAVFQFSPVLGIPGFFIGIILLKFASTNDRGRDPTVTVHEHAQDDFVAWGERIAEAEGPRVLGGAIAGILFGAAAEKEEARRTALEYYEAALDDLATLHPEELVCELARIAAVRGAKTAFALGETTRAKVLLDMRKRLLEKPVPQSLNRLPSLMTCKPIAALAADLDEEEERLYASLA
jgi:hypothetical protein